MGEKWINEDEFFDMTHQIWVPLFFSTGSMTKNSDVGWIEYRARSEEDLTDFISKMRSAELSASIIAWVLGLQERHDTLEKIRLYLSCILLVARLPWLWHGDENEQIAKELKPMLELTTNGEREFDLIEWEKLNSKWKLITRIGESFRQFELAIKNYQPSDIRHSVKVEEVKKGEILWQGSSGLCILLKDCHRSIQKYATVYKLQGMPEEKDFSPGFIIPMRALLMDYEILPTNALKDQHRKELLSMLDEISAGFNEEGLHNSDGC